MIAFVENLLLHIDELPLGVIFLFFFLSGFLQIAFPPYPGDTVLVFGGALGGLSLVSAGWLALFGYLSATVLTSLALYEIGYRMTDRIFHIPIIAKIMPVEKRASVEAKFTRFGVWLLAACKFIPGVNTLVILLGGVLRYPRSRGMLAITVSSIVHNLLFFLVGHLLGRNLNAINRFLRDYTAFAAAVIVLLCAAAGIYYLSKKRKVSKT